MCQTETTLSSYTRFTSAQNQFLLLLLLLLLLIIPIPCTVFRVTLLSFMLFFENQLVYGSNHRITQSMYTNSVLLHLHNLSSLRLLYSLCNRLFNNHMYMNHISVMKAFDCNLLLHEPLMCIKSGVFSYE